MSDFRITFSNPWLLFLLIPAVALTLFPYFRVAKRYRRNRNRIVSVVLHSLIMLFSIALLSGIMFLYNVPNKENEIIILVDSSYSNREEANSKDDFIQNIIEECSSNYKIGIVKFGYNQIYAAELNNDARAAFAAYTQSEEPDTAATDFAAALKYTAGLFKNPQSAKIVLLSDGFETDGSATSVIKTIAADGIKVDVVHFPNENVEDEVQIIGVETPDYNIDPGKNFRIGLTLQSNFEDERPVAVKVTDTYLDGTEYKDKEKTYLLVQSENVQTFGLEFAVDVSGFHEFRIEIDNLDDTIEENNVYYSYIMVYDFNNILIIENHKDESAKLKNFLDLEYNVTVYSIEKEKDLIPTYINELCLYEQVILVNIANSDMPDGFDKLLNAYVYTHGGGLFTVGGENDIENGITRPHAYNRDDMLGTLYQEMLPIRVVDYTPPLALMIIIDHSGSMGTGDNSAVTVAKQGAKACVDSLNASDFCGIMTLDDGSDDIMHLTSAVNKNLLNDAINSIEADGEGGTIFSNALDRAGAELSTANVDRRHILLVTDGQPSDEEEFLKIVQQNKAKGITMSVVAWQADGVHLELMKKAAETEGGGTCYDVRSQNQISVKMREDVASKQILDMEETKPFIPMIKDHTSAIEGIETAVFPELTGYYGTLARNDEKVKVPLIGPYGVPLYAHWQYGQGTVGSFMCDLSGRWSEKMFGNEVGERFLSNVIEGLFPVKDIRPQEMSLWMREENYSSQLNVGTTLQEGEKLEIAINPITEDAKQYYLQNEMQITSAEGGSRFSFVITCPGIYEIVVTKLDSNGGLLATATMLKTFSYSAEYDKLSEDNEKGLNFLKDIAAGGNGIVAEDSFDIFDTFVKFLRRSFDPRLVLLILILVLFLLDVAVRKFKFKWPHEIIRDYKEKKKMSEHDKH